MSGPWQYLPNPWRQEIAQLSEETHRTLEEIRFRLGRPVLLYGPDWIEALAGDGPRSLDGPQMERILAVLVDHSIYARVDELRQGYVTLPGGHRVGVAGRAVVANGRVETVNQVYGLNMRRARAVPEAGAHLLRRLAGLGVRGGSLLLLSPPRCGKTTLLRDLCRTLSDRGVRTVVIDERSEIAGLGGVGGPGFDLGLHTDVLDGWPKPDGIAVALRVLSPDLLIVDELGPDADVAAVRQARYGGVDVVATIHAGSMADLAMRPGLAELVDAGAFDALVLLSRRLGPGTVERVWPRTALAEDGRA
ncbi:MAG: stage III sporulation protein AA [Thermaerobacter sp.]|nr:stage III sporulation protein AA [Thermaerobacter sp.]